MARTAAEITTDELLMIWELDWIANNSVIYKGNTWVYTATTLWAAWTVLTSAWATSAPTFSVPAWWWDMLLWTVQTVTAEKIFDKDKISTKWTSTGKVILSNANTWATDYTQTLQAKNWTIANSDDTFYIWTTQVSLNRGSAALTLAWITLTTPDIGTPSAWTLTNCTSLPISWLTSSTSTALWVWSLELWHASDTTLSRSDAWVLAVEWVVIPSVSSTNTLTNKRITKRVVSAASYTTDTGTSLSVATADEFIVTAQAWALKLNNPWWTPVNWDRLLIRIKDNWTSRALTRDTTYRALWVTLPTATTASKTTYVWLIYNSDDSKRDVLAVGTEA